mmetsp:Transcript_55712/g.120397  ORF Transcript_55712/g.120397 Transcript_55712/m.120397 type:complete len:142 (-) Transcript_55712:279-704(-)
METPPIRGTVTEGTEVHGAAMPRRTGSGGRVRRNAEIVDTARIDVIGIAESGTTATAVIAAIELTVAIALTAVTAMIATITRRGQLTASGESEGTGTSAVQTAEIAVAGTTAGAADTRITETEEIAVMTAATLTSREVAET